MAWDPNQNQGQGQPGSGGQGQPGSSGQGQPGSGGPDPYSGYGTPQNPYGAPPPQNPYGTPPPQQGPIQELPNQYIKVVTKPSAQSFFEEMGKADWAIVWIQLLALAVIATIFGLLRGVIGLATNPFVTTGGFNFSIFTALTVSGSTFSFISVPLGFFIVVGIQYLIAKAFQGQGNFLTQSYATLLYQVPINVASYILGLIPIFGAIAGFALFVYGIILNVYAIMAVHRLSGGRATAVVLIPIAVLFLLVILCVIAVAAIFVVSTRTTGP